MVYLPTSEGKVRQRWQRKRARQERGDVRDENFSHVLQRFEPPASDERVILCDPAVALAKWIEQVIALEK